MQHEYRYAYVKERVRICSSSCFCPFRFYFIRLFCTFYSLHSQMNYLDVPHSYEFITLYLIIYSWFQRIKGISKFAADCLNTDFVFYNVNNNYIGELVFFWLNQCIWSRSCKKCACCISICNPNMALEGFRA